MISLQELSLQRGTKLLLDEVSLTIFAKQKIGLVGANGSGKSSLFAMLLGQLRPDAGSLDLQSNLRVAYLSQQIPNTSISALQYVMHGDQELTELLGKLNQAERDQDNHKVATLHNRIYELDGYTAESRAAKLLDGLGFAQDEHQKAVNEFSGGWRMRLNLGQVLMSRADLLLLDEPTNHLDLDAIIWLERWLQKYSGTLLLISHDREFLDNVVNKIVHIFHQKLYLYSGNYSSFEAQRAEKLILEQKLFEKQQAQIEHMQSFVNRFRAKASKASQAQSRIKAIEKLEKVVVTQLDSPFTFKFFETKKCLAPLLRFDDVSFAYEQDKVVLSHVNFSLNPGDRVGLLGPNGAGKSTFIKLMSGILTPNSGNSYVSKQLRVGYFAQHQVDQLMGDESPYAHFLELDRLISEQQVRNFLGSFNFHGDRIFEPVSNFSGGEKARLVLAMLVWQRPNILLLDEPTNHLDLDMREALTYAMQEYSGALVLVSHDRFLLRSAVDEFYLIYANRVNKFNGDLDDYQAWMFDHNKHQLVESERAAVVSLRNPDRNQNKTISKNELQRMEKNLNQLYQEMNNLESKLNDAAIYQKENQTILSDCLKNLEQIKEEITLLEKEWLSAQS